METDEVLGETDSAVELVDLFRSNSFFIGLLREPIIDKALRLFNRGRVGIVDNHRQFGDPVGNDSDARTHLTSSNHCERLDAGHSEQRSEYHLSIYKELLQIIKTLTILISSVV